MSKPAASVLERTCTYCGSRYTPKRYKVADNHFCPGTCKAKHQTAEAKAARQKKKVEDRWGRFPKSTLGQYLAKQCRRAGTVQIMHGHTADSLIELDAFHRAYYRCYGWQPDDRKSAFHRCHIQPLEGRDGFIGLLHPQNMFIGATAANQAQSNKLIPNDAGMRIPVSDLQRKWSVPEDATDKAILTKIRKLLGAEFDAFLDRVKSVDRDSHHATANRVYNRQQKGTAVNSLDRQYSLGELEALGHEVLQALDAYQASKQGGEKFKPEVYERAALCVYADELARLGNSLPDGRHRDNCLFMLALVQVLGMYIAQDEEVLVRSHRSFLRILNAVWHPLRQDCRMFWGKNVSSYLAHDLRYMRETILQGAYDALQGLPIDKPRFENHILKRLDIGSLVPVILAPDSASWKANGENWDQYISNLYSTFQPVWQSLVDIGLCTTDETEQARTGVLWSLHSAIEKARHQYRSQPRFKRWHGGKHYTAWGFKGYPEYLEYPDALVELFVPGPCANAPYSSYQLSMAA